MKQFCCECCGKPIALEARKNCFMRQFFSRSSSPRLLYWRLFGLGMVLLVCSLTLLGDTRGILLSVPAGGCYCHCAESHLRAGCVKMCHAKKYVSRGGATTCAKPHMRSPADNPNAGPRFPH